MDFQAAGDTKERSGSVFAETARIADELSFQIVHTVFVHSTGCLLPKSTLLRMDGGNLAETSCNVKRLDDRLESKPCRRLLEENCLLSNFYLV